MEVRGDFVFLARAFRRAGEEEWSRRAMIGVWVVVEREVVRMRGFGKDLCTQMLGALPPVSGE